MMHRLRTVYIKPDGASYTVTSKDTLEESGVDYLNNPQVDGMFRKASKEIAAAIKVGNGITIGPDYDSDHRRRHVFFGPDLARLLSVEYSIVED